MSVGYRAVGWNRQKKLYDGSLLGGIALYLALFVTLALALFSEATLETILLRALGTLAFLLLHVVLSIGPLARLDPRFLPWLYNRRHLGVATFGVGLAHGVFALVQFHALGDENPLVSVLASNTRFTSISSFPFQQLGLFALLVLFLMAATSHDFWLRNLTAPVWKALHMLVYAAYGALVLHVALGVLQTETHPLYGVLLGLGVSWILALHLVSGWRERARDRELAAGRDGFVDVCAVAEIPEKRARVATLSGERVAVFKHEGRISVLSNLCQHQNGPLGEGRIIDGLVTCPWHGYQYKPACGRSPEPFTERVPTFRARVVKGRVLVDPRPLPAGTHVEPAPIEAGEALHG
ncbi:MAG: ferric reductase-like transmembrane domain-containing protein [Planctomycetes bacterium]|nr:ferric reductase-like transmembrane domain-containing protein [Planctomycetota bacterium]